MLRLSFRQPVGKGLGMETYMTFRKTINEWQDVKSDFLKAMKIYTLAEDGVLAPGVATLAAIFSFAESGFQHFFLRGVQNQPGTSASPLAGGIQDRQRPVLQFQILQNHL